MKKVLFLSPNSFPKETGGSVLFRRLIGSLDFLDFFWFTIEKSEKKGLAIENEVSLDFSSIGFSGNLDRIARKIPIFGKLWFKLKYGYLKKKGLESPLDQFGQFDLVWVYISTLIIPFASGVLKLSNKKFHISVQDDIYGHLPEWEAKILENDYVWLLKNASTIDFVSESLKDYLFDKYNFTNKYKIICFADEIDIPKPIIRNKIKNIGFAGNVWSPKNFQTLLTNMKHLNQVGFELRLHIFSNNFPKNLKKDFSFEIINRGLLDNKSLLEALQEMDLVYVPMSFEKNKKILSSTSFPSKVFTYMNTGVPILFHAPEYSSVFKFIEKNNSGYLITSNENLEFQIEFEKILKSDVNEREIISEISIDLLKNNYSFSKQRSEFIDLILN